MAGALESEQGVLTTRLAGGRTVALAVSHPSDSATPMQKPPQNVGETIAPMPTETDLILPVLEAEPVVGEQRMRHDPTAAQGVPAHITVLAPFLTGEAVTAEDLDWLRELFAAVAPFRFTLATVADFPGALYLAPQPTRPFIELTEAVWRRWPDQPPYGGAYQEIVPHLTVAVGDHPWAELREQLSRRLPISATAREVRWIARRAHEAWHCVERLPLARATRSD